MKLKSEGEVGITRSASPKHRKLTHPSSDAGCNLKTPRIEEQRREPMLQTAGEHGVPMNGVYFKLNNELDVFQIG